MTAGATIGGDPRERELLEALAEMETARHAARMAEVALAEVARDVTARRGLSPTARALGMSKQRLHAMLARHANEKGDRG